MSISGIFQTGSNILNGATLAQLGISQNVGGMNDKNYHRVNAIFSATKYGVDVQFTRAYNQYTERSFVKEASSEHRWTVQDELLGGIQELFNESGDRVGMGKTLTKFFNSWNALSADPTNLGAKTEVLEVAQTLIQLLQSTNKTLGNSLQETEGKISSQVSKVNSLLTEIAALNTTLQSSKEEDSFMLLDKRDALTRELSEFIDIDIVNSAKDGFTITTKSGYTLVNGTSAYSLSLESNVVVPELTPNSGYTGKLEFSGSSNYEYKVEITKPGAVGVAEYRVSTDGGKTWLTNPETGSATFVTFNTPQKVGDIELNFTNGGALVAGDTFTVIPKTGLFWESTSASKVHISPQSFGNGTENQNRITGGSLAGLFSYRDTQAGVYQDTLNTFAKSLMWEVNQIYSQSAGTPGTNFSGKQQISNAGVPLSSSGAGLPFGDKLQNGTITFHTFDATGVSTAHTIDFDPATESADDLVTKINATGAITASIGTDGTLQLNTPAGTTMAFGKDTTGVMAGLGMNTFFTGSSVQDMAVNPDLVKNPSLLNTGSVASDGSISVGSNDVALALSKLQNTTVSITDSLGNVTKATLFDYYTALASKVGSDKDKASFQEDYYKTQAGFWYAKGQSEYGVRQDEEMINSLQIQDFYVAGTKLIETARTMLDQLLSVV